MKQGKYTYNCGFGNHFATEAVPGALPIGQNSPQQCPLGLYAEQLSGTAFTVPRAANQRSWLYRIHPSTGHPPFNKIDAGLINNNAQKALITPNQIRWKPFPVSKEKQDFVQGLITVACSGDPAAKSGLAVYVFTLNTSMVDKAFYNSDGDMLFVTQLGKIEFQTEFGWLEAEPGEIVVIPRGIRFRVLLPEGVTEGRGYVLEVYNGHFKIPDLGPIGANGLANPRDFLVPVAAYEDKQTKYEIVTKFMNQLFSTTQDGSPFDVVAWHGNYAPYKYDLRLFNAMNTVTFDHPDPSIFTVLTCQSNEPGVAIADFVIFPPRWAVGEHTFRPPYYHRNCMSEYMGLIYGAYEAKAGGFVPGGGSLHSCMTPHGPDVASYNKASTAELKPERLPDNQLAFMFETTLMLGVTEHAMEHQFVDQDYWKCWVGMKRGFSEHKQQ